MGVFKININYSVDKIRLKTEIHKTVLQNVILNPFSCEPGVSYEMKTSITAYRHKLITRIISCIR